MKYRKLNSEETTTAVQEPPRDEGDAGDAEAGASQHNPMVGGMSSHGDGSSQPLLTKLSSLEEKMTVLITRMHDMDGQDMPQEKSLEQPDRSWQNNPLTPSQMVASKEKSSALSRRTSKIMDNTSQKSGNLEKLQSVSYSHSDSGEEEYSEGARPNSERLSPFGTTSVDGP